MVRGQKPGDRSSPSPPRPRERKTASGNQRKKPHKEPKPAASENANDEDSRLTRGESLLRLSEREHLRDSRLTRGESLLHPSEREHLRGSVDPGEFSDNEGSPEETLKPPVVTPLYLNRGTDYKTVLVSVVASAVAVALMFAAFSRWQSASIPVGSSKDSKAWEQAIQAMQEQLRQDFDGKLAKLHFQDASEVRDIVKSSLKPYLDHIENHLLQDQLKQIVDEMLAKISIPSDESIKDIAMNIVKEQLELVLQERDEDLLQKLKEMEERLEQKIEAKPPPDDDHKEAVEKLQKRVGELEASEKILLNKLKEMEDRLREQIEEVKTPPDDGLKEAVEELQGRVGGLEQRGDGQRQDWQTQLSELESRLTGTESHARLLHQVRYATEKLQAEAMQNYLLYVGSMVLALLALLVACCSRSAKHAAPASAPPHSAQASKLPPTQTPSKHLGQVPTPSQAEVSPFLAQLQQREKEEREAVSQWSGTLQQAVCVVHFGHEHRQHHRQLAQSVAQGRVLEAAVQKTRDIPRVPGARLYLVFVSFNERNVILESREQGTGDLRQSTVENLLGRGAEVVVVYAGDKGSGELTAEQLYNPYLSSVGRHPILAQLSSRQHVLSIKTDFLQHQRQHLQSLVQAAMDRQTPVSSSHVLRV